MLHSITTVRKRKINHSTKQRAMQGRDEYQYTASIYDFLFSRGLRSIRTNIRTFLKHCGARNVIDLCCGTGEQLRMLSNEDIVLTGVDLSQAMLARARNTSPSSIHYLETDAANLPLPDDEYDGVIISFALHEKPAFQHEAIYREACRLLRHDGHIIIADYSTPRPGYASFIVGKVLIPIIERAAGLNHYHNYRDWMNQGALEGFLQRKSPGKLTLISPHSKECIKIYAISQIKDDPLSASLKKIQHHHSDLAKRRETE
jgi:ubiquinone/menaquinone biosynthesis C-methylase UbiE